MEPPHSLPRAGGRPRKWANPAAKHREHRRRRKATFLALESFIHAVINAHLPNQVLQQQVHAAPDDLAVLEALTTYYRARHWQAPRQPD